MIEDDVARGNFFASLSGMLFILRRAYAFGERGLLAHIGSRFGVPVIVRGAEVVDARAGVRPDNGVEGAMYPRQRFRRVLIGSELSLAVESIRQARPASALRSRSCILGWGCVRARKSV